MFQDCANCTLVNKGVSRLSDAKVEILLVGVIHRRELLLPDFRVN